MCYKFFTASLETINTWNLVKKCQIVLINTILTYYMSKIRFKKCIKYLSNID